MKLWLIVVWALIMIGCNREDNNTYERTCWNGGVIIYKENIMKGSQYYFAMDGHTKADELYGYMACRTKVIGTHNLQLE